MRKDTYLDCKECGLLIDDREAYYYISIESYLSSVTFRYHEKCICAYVDPVSFLKEYNSLHNCSICAEEIEAVSRYMLFGHIADHVSLTPLEHPRRYHIPCFGQVSSKHIVLALNKIANRMGRYGDGL